MSSIGVKGWLNAVSRRPSQLRNCCCDTSKSEGARRCDQPEPCEIWPRELRVSWKDEVGTWQLAQATFCVSPTLPSVPACPLLALSKSAPEKRVSKKNFLPSAAARGSSAKRLLASAG